MKMRIAFVLIGLSILASSCKNSEKETPSGLKFKIVDEGDGKLPRKNDVVVFQFVMKDSKDSTWSSTYERGMPGVVLVNDSSQIKNEDGMEQMFRMLSKGDSAVVDMPITKLFKDVFKQPLPPDVDSTINIIYQIRVDEVMDRDSFEKFQVTLMENKRKSQGKKDDDLIVKYLSEKNIKAQRDTTGLHYVLHESKGAAKPTVDNCVEVSYRGTLLKDEKVFDQSPKLAFPLANVIDGWKKGIPLMGVGDSITLYIPSQLAYGPQGVPGAIPPDAILIFDVRLLSSAAGYDEATRSCK
jgi:FKBP-type peptidyl-prolyl cis-trans isomerase FkpA